jgi:hypothetical protein
MSITVTWVKAKAAWLVLTSSGAQAAWKTATNVRENTVRIRMEVSPGRHIVAVHFKNPEVRWAV